MSLYHTPLGSSAGSLPYSLPYSLREAAVVAQIGDERIGHPVSTMRLALSPTLSSLNADNHRIKQDLLQFIVRLQPGTPEKDALCGQAASHFSARLVSPTGKTLRAPSRDRVRFFRRFLDVWTIL